LNQKYLKKKKTTPIIVKKCPQVAKPCQPKKKAGKSCILLGKPEKPKKKHR
jgi:hypothetical protein